MLHIHTHTHMHNIAELLAHIHTHTHMHNIAELLASPYTHTHTCITLQSYSRRRCLDCALQSLLVYEALSY